MSGPKVLNKYTATPEELEDSVYIGRPSVWGNPYIMSDTDDRMSVIEKFTIMLLNDKDLMDRAKEELRGKNLVCFCKPQYCHGDILLQVANAP